MFRHMPRCYAREASSRSRSSAGMAPGGIEPPHAASKAAALSAELRGPANKRSPRLDGATLSPRGGGSSVGRAPGCGPGGRGFESRPPPSSSVLHRYARWSKLTGMERSEEIRRLVERWIIAVSTGDGDAVVARMSEHSGSLLIGTDPNEWWESDARPVFARQMEESGGIPMSCDTIDAWEEGSCGWAS